MLWSILPLFTETPPKTTYNFDFNVLTVSILTVYQVECKQVDSAQQQPEAGHVEPCSGYVAVSITKPTHLHSHTAG